MNTNYNKISTKSNDDEFYLEIKETQKDPEETTENKIDKNPRIAKVINCVRLNVRRTPSKEGDVLRVINKGDELYVEENLNEDWCRIDINNSKGYVMRKFVT